MRKLVYYVGISIDGYIAGPGGEIDFFPLPDDMKAFIATDYPETLPAHAWPHFGIEPGTQVQAFDTLVMGRATYEPALQIGITSPYSHMRQYIVSTTLGAIDDPTVELVTGDPLELVRKLKAEDTGKDIWLAGGGKLAASLLPEIDELIVKSYAVVAGTGVRAFSGEFQPTEFTPTRRQELSKGNQVTWFTRS